MKLTPLKKNQPRFAICSSNGLNMRWFLQGASHRLFFDAYQNNKAPNQHHQVRYRSLHPTLYNAVFSYPKYHKKTLNTRVIKKFKTLSAFVIATLKDN